MMDSLSIDLKPYLDAIALLSERRNELQRLQKSSNYDYSVIDRLSCIDDELADLYDVVSYLRFYGSRKDVLLS